MESAILKGGQCLVDSGRSSRGAKERRRLDADGGQVGSVVGLLETSEAQTSVIWRVWCVLVCTTGYYNGSTYCVLLAGDKVNW